MKLFKRGLFIVLAVLLLVNTVYADSLSTNLTVNKVGPKSTFEGYVKFDFTDFKELSTVMVFNAGSNLVNVSLNRLLAVAGLFDNPNLILVDAIYINTTNNKDSEVTLNFASSGSKTNVGLDLSGRNRQPIDVNVQNISFSIEPVGSPQPNDVSIFIGDKRIFRHRGSATGWASLDRSYLGDFSPDGSQNVVGDSVFCQPVNVSDSGEYRINVSVKQLCGAGVVGLNATMISEGPISGAPDCSNLNTPCCSLNGISASGYNYAACTINKVIAEAREENICIYPTNVPDSGSRYFSVRTENVDIPSAFVNGNPAESNFYIFGDYRTYDRKLNRNSEVIFSSEDINSYIHGETGCRVNCLLVPFTVNVNSSGSVRLKNLNVPYSTAGGDFTEDKFRKIEFINNSASYNGTINVNLGDLEEVIAPVTIRDYDFYVNFNGFESNHVNFRVVAAPHAFIRYSTSNPGVGEEIIFDGGPSTSVTGRNITSYTWMFGDGNNASGAITSHVYTSAGNYTVTLKVGDSEGIFGFERTNISVTNTTTGTISDLVNQTTNVINQFRSRLEVSPEQVKDTANLLGIDELLSAAESDLTTINVEYNNILTDENLTEEQKNSALLLLRQQLDSLIITIPTSLRVDTSSFSGKVTGLNQIPSCCEFTTEEQKTKLLVAQRDITINAEARAVNVGYSDRTESFMIIKKDIIGDGANVYEFMPFGVSLSSEDVIIGGIPTVAAPNAYSFGPTNQLAYKVMGIDLSSALQIRTAVLPADLEAVDVSQEPIISLPSECGNNLCESDEDETSCPEDCKASNVLLYVLIIVGILLIGAIIYFGLFFKGGLLNKKFGSPKVFGGKPLFKNEKDHAAVRSFVHNSIGKGIDEAKIKVALKSKGWNDLQIGSVINEIKGSKNQPQVKR